MLALVQTGSAPQLLDVTPPRLDNPSDVMIQPRLASICRTDILVARGVIRKKSPVILGHEFVGTVVQAGANVTGLHEGDCVTAMPELPCGRCSACVSESPANCAHPDFLGVSIDGVFSQKICLPHSCVFKIHPDTPPHSACYTEPVAAALAVLQAGIEHGQTGAIFGTGRMALLVQKILQLHGFGHVPLIHQYSFHPEEHSFLDFVIETELTSANLGCIATWLKPRGLLILKSRVGTALSVDFELWLKKQLRIHCAYYGSFSEAAALIETGRIHLDDLMGPVFSLQDFSDAFAVAAEPNAKKCFFNLEQY